jgi:hypothetical protein
MPLSGARTLSVVSDISSDGRRLGNCVALHEEDFATSKGDHPWQIV